MNNILHINDIPDNRGSDNDFNYAGYILQLNNEMEIDVITLNNSYRDNLSNLVVDFNCPMCGDVREGIYITQLKKSKSLYCATCSSKRKGVAIPIGKRFGKLTYTGITAYNKLGNGKNRAVVTCVCDCGNTVEVLKSNLLRKTKANEKSCGKCRTPNEDDIARFIDLYETGLSSYTIGGLLGYHFNTVLKYLNLAGVNTSGYIYDIGRIYIINHNNIPIYVGKTQFDKEKRLSQHIKTARNKNRGPLAGLLDELDNIAIYLVEDAVPVSILAEREQYFIDKFSTQYNLRNISNAV